MIRLIKNISIALVVLIALGSCSKDEQRNVIPVEEVYFKLDMSNQDNTLLSPGNYKTYTSQRQATDRFGYSGLLVVCSYIALDGGEFQLYAYDLCCPYEALRNVKVIPQKDGKAKCPTCGSVYEMMTGVGNPISGPSKIHLQQYFVRRALEGNRIFYVTR